MARSGQTQWTLVGSASGPKRSLAKGELERQSALDAGGMLLDGVAEPAFVIEPERGAVIAEHVEAGAEIAHHIVGRSGDAELAHA